MRVEINELRLACEKIFSHLAANGNTIVEIPYDYYWNIPEADRYELNDKPNPENFDLGQLSDDWEDLRRLANGDEPPISYGLVWAAHIFTAIGEQIVE